MRISDWSSDVCSSDLRGIAARQLPGIVDDLVEAGCALRGDAAAQAIDARIGEASEKDWATEYLDAILSIRVVDGPDAAMAHIERYGSHHTESIDRKSTRLNSSH